MGKTRAEIQKAYRERLKAKNNDEYLAKERKRRRDSYIPSGQLSRKDLLRRNLKNRETLSRYRQRKRAMQVEEERQAVSDLETSGYDSVPEQTQGPLRVQLRFPNRRNGPRRRISRTLSAKSRQVNQLKADLHNLRRKYKTLQRKVQRKSNPGPSSSPETPRSQTAAQIIKLGLTKDQESRVKKHLLFGNVMMKELATAKSSIKPSKRRSVHNIIAGKIVKRYRCINMLSRSTGLSRNKLGNVRSKSIDHVRQRRVREVMRFREVVINFMSRDDNSRNLPGKGDKVKTAEGEYTQKRILTDYLSHLYQKFGAENPGIKLSLASFCRIRPRHILTTAFITRDCCLCTRHQNMALILKSLKPLYGEIPLNPEKYSKNPGIEIIRANLLQSELTYGQWKRVPVDVKGKTKLTMKIVQVTESKEAFFETLKLQTEEFTDHVSRLRTQYSQIRELKQRLPRHEAIVHMDFAENYNCKSVEEIQSAYWNQTSVTLHPVVVYTRPDEVSDLKHQSYVLVSDEMKHNSCTVITFLKHIIPEVKELDPDLQHVHYWTDSPTSQYRNKSIFNAVANHRDVFSVTATWNYFEAGHGKGPCDGLGGTVKRMADQAVNAAKVVIQDPTDFFAWSQSQHCSMPNVKFHFVSSEECDVTEASLGILKLKPVKGTMKIHAVKGQGNGRIHVRDTSCYCDICIRGTVCDTWREETTQFETEHSVHVATAEIHTFSAADISDAPPVVASTSDSTKPCYNVGDFVAALYSGNWYIGKIETVDTDDIEYEISFMEKKKCHFQWPVREDIIWLKQSDVLCQISSPVPSGKSKRMYAISKHDVEKIESHLN